MTKTLTPEQEAKAFDKVRDKRSGDNKPLTKEQKEKNKEREERNRIYAENSKREYLKPFLEFLADPLDTIKFLCSQGDFAGSYDKRIQLFNLMTMVQIQKSLESLISVLKSRK